MHKNLESGIGMAMAVMHKKINELETENGNLKWMLKEESEARHKKDPPKTIFPYPVRFRAPQPGHRPPCCPCCDKDMMWKRIGYDKAQWECKPCGLRISQEEE